MSSNNENDLSNIVQNEDASEELNHFQEPSLLETPNPKLSTYTTIENIEK